MRISGFRSLAIVLSAIAAIVLSSEAICIEAVLVHDIAPPHPRYKNFYEMVYEVAKRTDGLLTIAVNPGGKVLYPGQASLDAVRSKKVPLTFVNSAFLQSIDPRLGFLNLPFTVSDETMTKPGVLDEVLNLVRKYVAPAGLDVLGIMRGANTIFIFKDRQVRRVEDLSGLKIRVAGPGVYQEIVKSLGAEPTVIPAIEMGEALKKGTIHGIITSPGGWGKNVGDAPIGSQVPGLIFYTYFFIADRGWLSGLQPEQRRVLEDVARSTITGKWSDMMKDDLNLISSLISHRGASFYSVPLEEIGAWKVRVEGVKKSFSKQYPDIVREFEAILAHPDRP